MVIRFPSKDNDDPKRRAMAKWIDEQRQAYRDGTLSQERIEKLEQLPGWNWDPTDDAGAEETSE